jgi:CHRD domain
MLATRCQMLRLLVLAAAAALVVHAAPASASAAIERTAKLRGTEEVPGPGAFDGRGKARITVRRGVGELCFDLRWRGIQQPTSGHVHRGEDGEAGPIKVTLFDDPSGLPGPTAEGCVEDVRPRLLKRIAKRPTQYYVNLNNAQFPDGAIRGQLRKPGGGGQDGGPD